MALRWTLPLRSRPQAPVPLSGSSMPGAEPWPIRSTKEFVQGYNAQAAVDSQAQVIVACGVTQAAADVGQFVPMLRDGRVQQPASMWCQNAAYPAPPRFPALGHPCLGHPALGRLTLPLSLTHDRDGPFRYATRTGGRAYRLRTRDRRARPGGARVRGPENGSRS